MLSLAQVQLSSDKPLLRAQAAAGAAAAEAARVAKGLPPPVESGIPIMMDVRAVVGVHQFSGSWKTPARETIKKSHKLIRQASVSINSAQHGYPPTPLPAKSTLVLLCCALNLSCCS